MTEEEANRQEFREFRLRSQAGDVDLVPDFVYCDEPKRSKIFKPVISEREIQARALRFAGNIMFRSRTHKTGQLR